MKKIIYLLVGLAIVIGLGCVFYMVYDKITTVGNPSLSSQTTTVKQTDNTTSTTTTTEITAQDKEAAKKAIDEIQSLTDELNNINNAAETLDENVEL